MLLKNGKNFSSFLILGAVFATDIYGIGAIMFELLVGTPPFYNYNVLEMFDSIKEGNITFPSSMSKNAQDLIKVI